MTSAESRPVPRDGVPAPDDVRDRIDDLDAPAQEKVRAEAADAAAEEAADEAAGDPDEPAGDVAEASHPAPEPPD